MTLEELWEHINSYPSRMTIYDEDNNTEWTEEDADEMDNVVEEYGDETVRYWDISCIAGELRLYVSF